MIDDSRKQQDYFIGGLDAWGDLERLHLEEIFLPIYQYREVVEYDRCFLCGRRGAGKSAIALMLDKSDSWDNRTIFEGERSQYGVYLDLVESIVGRQKAGMQIDIKRSISLLWQYVLRILVIQSLVKNAERWGISNEGLFKKEFLFG